MSTCWADLYWFSTRQDCGLEPGLLARPGLRTASGRQLMRFHGDRTTSTTATAHGTRRSHWPPLAGRPRVGSVCRVTSGPRLCPGPVVWPGWPRLVAGVEQPSGDGAAASCCHTSGPPARVLAINEVAIIFCKKCISLSFKIKVTMPSNVDTSLFYLHSLEHLFWFYVISFMMSCSEQEMR